MKLQATVLLSFQAKTLAEAGAPLDAVLDRARARDAVDIAGVEFSSPPADRAVTLPPVSAPVGYEPRVPSSGNGSEPRALGLCEEASARQQCVIARPALR